MSDVVAQTGLSQRTIYRMVAEGRLRQGQRRVPGRRPMAVFDPEAVAEISASTIRSGDIQEPAPERAGRAGKADVRNDDFDSGLPPSELSFKLYLTEQEAIRYTSFGRAWLRAHGKGKPIGPHGSRVYRRVDLEKL
jgi:hypothetical protein